MNFPHKTPSNFYSSEEGFGLAESKNEGELWLERLPYDSILVKPDYCLMAIKACYGGYTTGTKDGEFYHVMIPLVCDRYRVKQMAQELPYDSESWIEPDDDKLHGDLKFIRRERYIAAAMKYKEQSQ